jgi:hypothetical protein
MYKPRKDGVTILHLAAVNNDIWTLNYVLRLKRQTNIDIVSDDVSTLNIYLVSRGGLRLTMRPPGGIWTL